MKAWRLVELAGACSLMLGVVIQNEGELFGIWFVLGGAVVVGLGRLGVWLAGRASSPRG
jgi:hypothetical protein